MVKAEGKIIIEKDLPRIGKRGNSYGFNVPASIIDALTAEFNCRPEELAKVMRGKIWFVKGDKGIPYMIIPLGGGDDES